MSLQDELATLQQEKESYLERMQKLEARRDKVRPELYEKLRGEIDEKTIDVEARIADVQRRIEEEREREEAERRAAEEEARRQAEEEAQRRAEDAAHHLVTPETVRDRVVQKYAAELEVAQTDWQKQVADKRAECEDYIVARGNQRAAFEKEIEAANSELEEIDLRAEIGEFEDNEAEYESLKDGARQKIETAQKEVTVAAEDIEQVEIQLQELDTLQMPVFADQLVEKYGEEVEQELVAEAAEAAAEEEEVYEPVSEEDFAGGRIVAEEEIEYGEDGEPLVTEVEEIFEDEVEQGFFHDADVRDRRLISTTINPCLIEEKPDGGTRVHNLVLTGTFAGGRTMIGSQEDCDVYLPYPDVAPKHAWIKVDRKGTFYLKDLGGGTYVNDKRAKKVQLHNGDRLRIGNVTLTAHLM
ncbi:MAG: FHA domain-containing protein [Candidatus Lernaella stagnicola]|nr:FHA domain-containing protein [Candidatus Lernaella stagnicola]